MNRKMRRAAASCARRKNPRGPEERGSNQLTHGKVEGTDAYAGFEVLDLVTAPERNPLGLPPILQQGDAKGDQSPSIA